jgi:universal stress protein A
MTRPTVLCPVDFSDASRGALRYAATIAEHFGATLVVLAVEDPLLTEALDFGTGVMWDPETTRRELVKLAADVVGVEHPSFAMTYEVVVGRPADEILRMSRARHADLIVMSTHGLTGMRKLFFGSTTERVLRETTVPVLATHPVDPGPVTLHDLRALVRRILVPVDLSPESLHQIQVAKALSQALDVPFIAAHVVEPLRSPFVTSARVPDIELERMTRADDALGELIATVPRQLRPEMIVAHGDPAEQIATAARDRHAGLVVIGLRGPGAHGPRMGSVTYRVLCLAPALVLALPPDAGIVAAERGAASSWTVPAVYK